jgi:hypothetical protein
MKRFIVLLGITLVLSCSSNAQIEQGYWLAGGALSFSKQGTEPSDETVTSLSLSPKIGYFIFDNFCAGINLKWNSQTNKFSSSSTLSKSHYQIFEVGPFARYYFLKNGGHVNVFIDGSALFGNRKQSQGSSIKTFEYVFTAGPEIFFTNSAGLEISVGYQSINFQTDPVSKWHSTFIEIGFHVHLTNKE